jgi:hypothetical protein
MKFSMAWRHPWVACSAILLSGPAFAQPSAWQVCAVEGQLCRAPAGATVRYGAQGQFVTMRGIGTIECSNAAFGSDPAPGVPKVCELQGVAAAAAPARAPGGWQPCAVEGQYCSAPAGATVRFGANGRYVSAAGIGPVDCSNRTFGSDPTPGVPKVCEYQGAAAPVFPASPTSGVWQHCAVEGQFCSAPNGAIVRFGSNGQYVSTSGTGPVDCSTRAFGSDPTPGVKKSCQYQAVAAAPQAQVVTRPAPPPTQPTSQRDRCHDYSNEMIGIDQRGRRAGCSGWTGHSDYNRHYDWCTRQSSTVTDNALADWGTRLQTCQFAASGSPAAAADMARIAASDRLGRRWQTREGAWTGEWTRVGNSNRFKAVWTHPTSAPVMADMTVQIDGDNVRIERTDTESPQRGKGCSYIGTAQGRAVRGTLVCDWAAGRELPWTATIN